MTLKKVKPIADQFDDHCGTCKFCHPGDTRTFNCWVDPPQYAYGDENNPVILRGQGEVKVTNPACRHYIPRNVQ